MRAQTIAAAETFRVSGGDRVQTALAHLWDDLKAVHRANVMDNKKDDDGDGVADVDQISKQALMTRKAALVLKTVNPNRLLQATGALAQAFAGVCATLKLQFAKVISVAVSISDNVRPLLLQFLAPALVSVIPCDFHHWIFPVIDVMAKVLGMSLAWFLFRVIAAGCCPRIAVWQEPTPACMHSPLGAPRSTCLGAEHARVPAIFLKYQGMRSALGRHGRPGMHISIHLSISVYLSIYLSICICIRYMYVCVCMVGRGCQEQCAPSR